MIFERFKQIREEHPDAAAFLVSTGERAMPISWRTFTDDVDAVAHIIRQYVPGTVIGLLGANSYEWIVCHAAIVLSGAIVTPVDANLRAGEIADRLRFVKASALIYSSLYEEVARDVAKLYPGLAIGGFGTRQTERFVDRARHALAADPSSSLWAADSVSFSPTKTSMIVFTSGTTSKPRGAELTLEAVETFYESWKPVLPMKFGHRSLMLLPLHHIFGISTTYMMLCEGVALGVCADFRRIYDSVERFSVNHLFLVPALAEILGQKIQQRASSAEEAFGQPLDWILVGGAPLHRRTYERLTSLGVKMLTGYGLTETTALYSVTPLHGDPHVGAQGLVAQHPRMETKVSADGELMIRGPAVMKDYYQEPERTAKVLDSDGWFHTGDYGSIDKDGFVIITGRASRTIILSSGKKIAPEELEERLLMLPGVSEAVVSGEGESRDIRAEVYATTPEVTTRNAIAQMNLSLPVYKRIKTVVIRSEPFPRTSSGKIRIN